MKRLLHVGCRMASTLTILDRLAVKLKVIKQCSCKRLPALLHRQLIMISSPLSFMTVGVVKESESKRFMERATGTVDRFYAGGKSEKVHANHVNYTLTISFSASSF